VDNLYSITTNQPAIAALFGVMKRHVGNLPPVPGVFPDYAAPVVHDYLGGRELIIMRWGIPAPPQFGGAPVTNIRNTASPHWRGWLKPKNRCPAIGTNQIDCTDDPSVDVNDIGSIIGHSGSFRRSEPFAGHGRVDDQHGERQSRPKPLNSARVTDISIGAALVTDARGRSLAMRRSSHSFGVVGGGVSRPRACA
jgi:hypothetical protein